MLSPLNIYFIDTWTVQRQTFSYLPSFHIFRFA